MLSENFEERSESPASADDPDFRALRQAIVSGSVKPNEQAGLYVHEIEHGRQLGVKNPCKDGPRPSE